MPESATRDRTTLRHLPLALRRRCSLAGCTTDQSTPSPRPTSTPPPGREVNIASLTAVIEQQPERRQRLQRPRHRLRQGRQAQARRSPTSTPPSSSTRASTRPMPTGRWSSAGSAATTSRSPTTTARSRSTRATTSPISAAATSTGRASRSTWRSPISTRRSSSTPTTRAPITIARSIYQALRPAAARHRRFLQGDRACRRPISSRSGRAASPISPSATTRPRSRTSTRWSSATAIPTRLDQPGAGAGEARRARQGLRRLRQGRRPQPELPPGASTA